VSNFTANNILLTIKFCYGSIIFERLSGKMTSKILSVVAVSLALFGCGSGPVMRSSIGNPEAGAAGSPTETGGSATGGNDTGGTGGGSATGGSAPTGGSAGQVTSTGGSETGGSGGTCVPKTCETIAAELTNYDPASGVSFPDTCGVVSDGCNGYQDCGGCANSDQVCGKGTMNGEWIVGPSGDWIPVELNPIPNICGGTSDNGNCPTVAGGCTLSNGTTGTISVCLTNAPPSNRAGCESVIVTLHDPWQGWCCPPN
jgi:hypothetical protein